MTIPILKILKELIPIVAGASEAAAAFAGVRKSAAHRASEERIRTLEEEVARIAQVTARLAEQTQAIAEELRAQAVVNAAQEKKTRLCLVLSIGAACLAVAALVVALVR